MALTDKQQGTLEGIEATAGMAAQQLVLATVNQAVAAKLLPAENFAVSVDVKIKHRLIALASTGSGTQQ